MWWGFKLELKKGMHTKKVWAVLLIMLLLYVPLVYVLKQGMHHGGEISGDAAMSLTIQFITGMALFFLGILAIVMGATAVNKEVEEGTIRVVLSKRISRLNYILGKFLGQSVVFFIAVLLAVLVALAGLAYVGVDLTGSVVSDVLLLNLVLFMVMVEFLALGYILSTFLKSSSSALGIALVVFFVIYLILPIFVQYEVYTHTPGNISEGGLRDMKADYYTKYLFYSPTAQAETITSYVSDEKVVQRTVNTPHGTGTYMRTITIYRGVGYAIKERWINFTLLIVMSFIYLAVAVVRFVRMDLR